MLKFKLLAATLVATAAAAAALPAAAHTRVDVVVGLPAPAVVYRAPVVYEPAIYAPVVVEESYWVPARWEWRGPSRVWIAGFWAHGPRGYAGHGGWYRGGPAYYGHAGYRGYRR